LLVSIYFITMAIFPNGLWSLFFWAIGISVFAKWLAEGFDNSKERIAYEAKLMDEGYSLQKKLVKYASEYIRVLLK